MPLFRLFPDCGPAPVEKFEKRIGVLFRGSRSLAPKTGRGRAFPVTRRHSKKLHEFQRDFIRVLRGGAQAHLLEGEDGAYYVAKFTNNPQHRRILINEWLACAFLRYLQIYVP